MFGFHEIDLMSRGGSLTLLILWSWILLRDHRDLLAGRLAVAMNVAIACYLIRTSGWAEGRSPLWFVLELGAGSTPGFFWLFARAWFGDRTRIGRIPIALVCAAIANMAVLQLTFPDKSVVFYCSAISFRAGMFAFAAAGFWEAWRGRDDDLVEGRRRLRLAIIASVGLYVVAIAIAEVGVYQFGAPRAVVSVIGSSIVLVTLVICASMFGFRQTDLLGERSRPLETEPVALEDHPLAQRLLAVMGADLPHRDETMTIAKLASQLGEQEYRLRRLINGTLGYRNFAQFLNGYRLAEVRSALADPTQKDVSILTIALDAGFGSLGPFNRAFREAEGMTPTTFRTRAA